MKTKRAVLVLILAGSIGAYADECDLNRPFGPVSFNRASPVEAVKQVLAGTGIALVDSGYVGEGTITAGGLKGTLSKVMASLADGANFTWTCSNNVIRLSNKGSSANMVSSVSGTASGATNANGTATTGDGQIAPVKSPWVLTANQSISEGLHAWGQIAGWKVIWNIAQDWSVPQTTAFKGDFLSATQQVVSNLSANGADIHAAAYSGNQTIVISGAGTNHAE